METCKKPICRSAHSGGDNSCRKLWGITTLLCERFFFFFFNSIFLQLSIAMLPAATLHDPAVLPARQREPDFNHGCHKHETPFQEGSAFIAAVHKSRSTGHAPSASRGLQLLLPLRSAASAPPARPRQPGGQCPDTPARTAARLGAKEMICF